MPLQDERSQRVETSDRATELKDLLETIAASSVVFFPVRHHSPACAWHLQKCIRECKPDRILIEGPANFTPLIPLMLHPKTRSPFAIYTNFIDSDREIFPGEEDDKREGNPPRFAAYYPFCDFTPELVALRTGAAIGAQLQFIDLTYPEQVWAERGRLNEESQKHVDSLMAERHLKRSACLRRLAQATGCRDQDDLWDHLFEVRYEAVSTNDFIRNVVAYCCLARMDCEAKELEEDGTLPRERAMASAIMDAWRASAAGPSRGRVLVVTGGFHTVALPGMIGASPGEKERIKIKGNAQAPVLVRYSFDQLDSLNGYAAGMPSPQYYDFFWSEVCAGQPAPLLEAALRVIVEIGRLTRERKLPNALSSADAIAALAQARSLAVLRGHPGPAREDILDGIRSCFVKGSMDAEGEILMGLAHHVLSGTAIGDIPPEAGVPPLVDHFRQVAGQLRLNIHDSVRKKMSLDIYRKVAHRKVSRLFHTLAFLDAPFATLAGGPDFVSGTGLDLLHEHWDYAWSPRTESALVDASIYGSTLEEAASNRLKEAITALQTEGKSRNAGVAVAMLIRACRMGLHPYTGELLKQIRTNIEEDSAFVSVTEAANQLVLLWQSREPLEAHSLREIPELANAAYQRLCYLMDGLAQCPQEDVLNTLSALCLTRELLASARKWLDPDLFWEAEERLMKMPQASTPIVGGSAGLLYTEGRLSTEALLSLVRGQLSGATGDSRTKVGFMMGLLRTCREAAWQHTAILEALNTMLDSWDDQEFIHLLPELRLTFADLTPGETDRVAGAVASMYGKKELGDLVHHDVTENQMRLHLKITEQVVASLKEDGLGMWAKT